MNRRPTALIIIAAVAVLAIVLAGSRLPAALAHGIGTPQVLNAPAGPYMLSAWTDPDPLRADETHVVVAVIDPDTREMIVSGVEVAVTMTSMDDPSVVHRAVAGTDSVNQLLYAAEFNGRVSEGPWRVGVMATGAQGTSDEVVFEVEIDPARGNRWLWIGLGGMAVLVAGWLFLSMQPERPARAARRRRAAG